MARAIPIKELDEVVMLGRHPTRDVDLLVLTSVGTDAAWQHAAELAGLYLDHPEARFATPPDLVIVDMGRDHVRAAHHLRRIR